MKIYDDSHWVTKPAVTGRTGLDIMGAVASDLDEGKKVLTELYAYYLTEGSTFGTREGVQGILEDVFETPLSEEKDKRYMREQVQSMYVLGLTAQDLVRFCEEATARMIADTDEHGFAEYE